jgi:hypothetical protein
MKAPTYQKLVALFCISVSLWLLVISCASPPMPISPSPNVNEMEIGPTPLSGTQSPGIENSKSLIYTSEAPQIARGLFLPAEAPKKILPATIIPIIRSRFVTVQFDQFWKTGHQVEAKPEVSDTLILNLFDDAVYTAILSRIETSQTGSLSWIGYISGMDNSQVILVVLNQNMSGTIALPKAVYRVRFAGEGEHVIEQINQAGLPKQEEPPMTTPQP